MSDLILRKLGWTLHVKKVWHQEARQREAALDAGAWMFNVVTSVGIIMVNKALMATHGFSFGKTLTVP